MKTTLVCLYIFHFVDKINKQINENNMFNQYGANTKTLITWFSCIAFTIQGKINFPIK